MKPFDPLQAAIAAGKAACACFALCVGAASAGDVSVFQSSSELDLAGDFLYAINFGPSAPTANIDGLDFASFAANGDVAGVTSAVPAAPRSFDGTAGFFSIFPALGGDPDINPVLGAFIDSNDTIEAGDTDSIDLDLDVVSGQPYKLQLLFSEGFFTAEGMRVFDVAVEGETVVNGLDPYQEIFVTAGLSATGDSPMQSPGAVVVTHEFIAGDANLDITLSNIQTLSVISGLTLESVIPEPSTGVLLAVGALGVLARSARKQ